jgi:hypothetical protein
LEGIWVVLVGGEHFCVSFYRWDALRTVRRASHLSGSVGSGRCVFLLPLHFRVFRRLEVVVYADDALLEVAVGDRRVLSLKHSGKQSHSSQQKVLGVGRSLLSVDRLTRCSRRDCSLPGENVEAQGVEIPLVEPSHAT